MRRLFVAGIVALTVIGRPEPAGAGASFLGGFRPVAAEESARALWVNPAAIGSRALATVSAEAVWLDTFDRFRGYSLAITTDRYAYGFQKETDDFAGVADWTLGFGARTMGSGAFRFGWAVEYRGGDENKFDGTLGFDYSLSRSLKGSLAVIDVLEADTDGSVTVRTWRPGVRFRSPSLKGRFTYDAIVRDSDDQHWFGLAFDRTKKVQASFAINTDGDWNVTVDLVLPKFLAGAGLFRRDGGGDRTGRSWVAVDWRDRQSVGRRGSSRSLVDASLPGFLPSSSPLPRETP